MYSHIERFYIALILYIFIASCFFYVGTASVFPEVIYTYALIFGPFSIATAIGYNADIINVPFFTVTTLLIFCNLFSLVKERDKKVSMSRLSIIFIWLTSGVLGMFYGGLKYTTT